MGGRTGSRLRGRDITTATVETAVEFATKWADMGTFVAQVGSPTASLGFKATGRRVCALRWQNSNANSGQQARRNGHLHLLQQFHTMRQDCAKKASQPDWPLKSNKHDTSFTSQNPQFHPHVPQWQEQAAGTSTASADPQQDVRSRNFQNLLLCFSWIWLERPERITVPDEHFDSLQSAGFLLRPVVTSLKPCRGKYNASWLQLDGDDNAIVTAKRSEQDCKFGALLLNADFSSALSTRHHHVSHDQQQRVLWATTRTAAAHPSTRTRSRQASSTTLDSCLRDLRRGCHRS